MRAGEPETPSAGAPTGSGALRAMLLLASFGLLAAIGLTGPNAAQPDLGPRGWAPGSLPWQLGPAAVALVLAAAYLVGAAAVVNGWLQRERLPTLGWWHLGALLLLALLSAPFGSADHVNYAAYGRIDAQGGDPYVVPPISWHGGHDPITSRVEAPWTRTPSVYGPFATLLQRVCAELGGSNLRQVVWLWQVVIVGSWLVVRWLLRRIVEDQARVDLLWTANPLVFGVGVLGGHIDMVATALAVAVVVLAARSVLLGGAVLGLAFCTKFTYAVVGVGLVAGWVWEARQVSVSGRVSPVTASSGRSADGRMSLGGRLAALASSAAVVIVVLHLWAGPHVYDQLARARSSVSLATPWRPLLNALHGPLTNSQARTVVSTGAALVAIGLAWALWRATRGLAAETVAAQALRVTFVLATAYALAAPYSLPWYDELTWGSLPALGASTLDVLLVGRGAVMAVAYVPGRVLGMSPAVQRVTLGFRTKVGPYAGLLAWAGVLLVSMGGGRPGSSPEAGSRPRGPARSSR